MSIARIAQAANVSYATAWRIINNHPCSSADAVRAVKQAMSKMGYDPVAGRRRGRPAKKLDGIRTHNVALLHLREGTSISTSVLSRVQQMLAERNLNLIFAHVEDAEDLPQALRAGNVDGILGYGQYPEDAITPAMLRVPAVWMMTRFDLNPDRWGDRVLPDHLLIGQLAANHLLAKGHRCVGYMNPEDNQVIHRQRLSSFRMAAEAGGATVVTFGSRDGGATISNLTSIGDAEQRAERLVEQWMQSNPRPTGLFVPVDRATIRVYRQLQQHGVRVGTDVEIVSCDNEKELLSLMHPAPASIDLNKSTIARLAVERLYWRMRNGLGSPRVTMTVSPTLDGVEDEGVAVPAAVESAVAAVGTGDAGPNV